MMFFIWGSKGNIISLGGVGTRDCQFCEKSREFEIALTYRYGHFYWIPLFLWDKSYFLHCQICNRGYDLEESEVKPILSAEPVPWMHRLGWTVVLGAILVLVLAFSV